MLLNVAAHNVSIRNVKVSKCECHRTYSVTKRYTFSWRCTLCNIYVMKTLRFGTLTLCSYVLQHYVMWRLRYVALRYVATSVNHVLDSAWTPHDLNPLAGCSGRLFLVKRPTWWAKRVGGCVCARVKSAPSPSLPCSLVGRRALGPHTQHSKPSPYLERRITGGKFRPGTGRRGPCRYGVIGLSRGGEGWAGPAGNYPPGRHGWCWLVGGGGRQAAQWRQSGEGKGCQ